MRSLLFPALLVTAPLLASEEAPSRATTPSPQASHERWKTVTQGTNLALGREVTFSLPPNYRLTVDDNDKLDLTTGELVQQDGDRIWFSRKSVGWLNADNGVTMLVDLGSSEPVGRVAIRFLGGKPQPILPFPGSIKIALSDDGKNYFEAAELQKVTEGESELAEQFPERYFFRDEDGTPHTETFFFDLNRKARYVAITASSPSGFLFTDQLAIIKAEGESKGLADLKPTRIITRGQAIAPKGDELVITTNIPTPQFFQLTDARQKRTSKELRRFFFQLPEGVRVDGPPFVKITAPTEGNRWLIEEIEAPRDRPRAYGPFFFSLADGTELAKDSTATFSVDAEDSSQNASTVPLRTVEIPPVDLSSELEVSLGWFNERHQYQFPEFLKNFRKLGFNTISTFPRTQTTPEDRERQIAFVKEARQQGYRVLYNESAFHEMLKLYGKHDEIYNQVGGKKGRALCPTYTGTYYQKEMDRVNGHARDIRPDVVFFDIELWHRSVAEAEKCSRCQEAWKASGEKSWKQFLEDQGTRMMRDLNAALNATAPDGSTPPTGLYNVQPGKDAYHSVFRFESLYPKLVQLSQPSLYVQGEVQRVHTTLAENHKALNSRQLIPWLTAGTYGEFPPHKLEQMIYEAFLNGSRGITYYAYVDFEPMDFYHHAAALRTLSPFAQLLTQGKSLSMETGNALLTGSAFGTDEEALLLVGNYQSPQPQKARLSLASGAVLEVRDLLDQEKSDLSVSELDALEVPAGEQRLLWIKLAPATTAASPSSL